MNLGNSLREQGRTDESIRVFKELLSRKPDYLDAWSSFCLTLNYASSITPEQLFKEHCACGARLSSVNSPARFAETIATSRERPLKVGYVSGDFRDHSVARFFGPVLAQHDRARIESVCYYNGPADDQVTTRLKGLANKWRYVRGVSDDQVINIIRDDRIDILVDLSGHTSDNRLTLFARRAAPIQATYLGYPNTTGLTNMDFRITDKWADPEGQERFYTETLIRLPGGFLCYGPPAECPPVNDLPALKNGYITFGSFNNLAKVNDSVVALWARVLHKVPGSKLLLKNRQLTDANVRTRYLALFESSGIQPDRVLLLPPSPGEKEHLSTYNQIDIALDTFPYNGTTTTCEALWMGVPVVTLAGVSHASRVGVSILTRLGLASLVADSPELYERLCAFLSSDFNYLAKLRQGLRNAMQSSPLCDATGLTRELEDAFLCHSCSIRASSQQIKNLNTFMIFIPFTVLPE